MNLDHNVMPKVKYHRICHERKSKRVCVFSTYDENSVVQDYVLHCLTEIKRYGFEIIFVSTSDGINQRDEEKVAEFSSNIVIRQNEGYDFTSWKVGTKYISWDVAETVLFLNDSIIFPLYDFADEMEKMVHSSTDFWGLIDSSSNGYFVNSFFWIFNYKITKSRWFREFCDNIPLKNKKYYVENYEAEIINLLKRKKLSYRTFIKTKNLYIKYNNKCVEKYTHYRLFWDILCDDYRSPFVKKNILLRSNKEHLIFTSNIEEYLSGSSRLKVNLPPRDNKKVKKYREIISSLRNWRDKINTNETVCVYGDCFVSRLISNIAGYEIVFKSSENEQWMFTKKNNKKKKIVGEKEIVTKYNIMIIGTFDNYDEVIANLKSLEKNIKFVRLDSIFGNKIGYLYNISTNIKYALMYVKTRKDAMLIINQKYLKDIIFYLTNDCTYKVCDTKNDILFKIKYKHYTYVYI